MTEKDVYKNGVALLEEWEDVNYCEHSFKFKDEWLTDKEVVDLLNELHEESQALKKQNKMLRTNVGKLTDDITYLRNLPSTHQKENKQLKAQLYCDDEEGVCNICKHHYLVKDDESELGYYNSRCKKGHYECARVSLKYCEDFEKEL